MASWQFVDTIDNNLVCSICLEVAENPQQEVTCGKLFCQKCLEKIKVDQSCPNCRARKPQYFEDKKSFREIQSLKVKCRNTENGCTWTGLFSAASDHVTKSCDFAMVTCKYEDIGCSERSTRKRMREHEGEDALHLSLCLQTTKKLMELIHTIPEDDGATVKMPNFIAKKNNNEIFYSRPYYIHHRGFKVCLAVQPNGAGSAKNTYLSVGIQLLEGPYDSSLTWPFKGTVTIKLLNQLQDKEHYSNVVHIDSDDNVTLNTSAFEFLAFRKFISHEDLGMITTRKRYLKDDTLYFNFTVECKKVKPWLNRYFQL